MNKKGVIVGSTDSDFCNVLLSKPHHAYVLGLWCADGYHRTSSIGLSSVSEKLAQTFLDFFIKYFDFSRLKLRIYLPVIADADFEVNRLSKIFGIKTIRQYRLKKAKVPTLHLYVNSRPMLRSFREARRAVVREQTRKSYSRILREDSMETAPFRKINEAIAGLFIAINSKPKTINIYSYVWGSS